MITHIEIMETYRNSVKTMYSDEEFIKNSSELSESSKRVILNNLRGKREEIMKSGKEYAESLLKEILENYNHYSFSFNEDMEKLIKTIGFLQLKHNALFYPKIVNNDTEQETTTK